MIDMRDLAARVLANDPTAADELDALADRLKLLAQQIRDKTQSPFVEVDGVSDRVIMKVISPDGHVTQHTDTKALSR